MHSALPRFTRFRLPPDAALWIRPVLSALDELNKIVEQLKRKENVDERKK
jgi:hypothetical protein